MSELVSFILGPGSRIRDLIFFVDPIEILHTFMTYMHGKTVVCVSLEDNVRIFPFFLFVVNQVLQGNGVTISCIIPSLIGLDKTLQSRSTNYTHFSKALRTGLHTNFQSLIHEKDIILAAVLNPRNKLKVLHLEIIVEDLIMLFQFTSIKLMNFITTVKGVLSEI